VSWDLESKRQRKNEKTRKGEKNWKEERKTKAEMSLEQETAGLTVDSCDHGTIVHRHLLVSIEK
jgi:hypothetical protein